MSNSINPFASIYAPGKPSTSVQNVEVHTKTSSSPHSSDSITDSEEISPRGTTKSDSEISGTSSKPELTNQQNQPKNSLKPKESMAKSSDLIDFEDEKAELDSGSNEDDNGSVEPEIADVHNIFSKTTEIDSQEKFSNAEPEHKEHTDTSEETSPPSANPEPESESFLNIDDLDPKEPVESTPVQFKHAFTEPAKPSATPENTDEPATSLISVGSEQPETAAASPPTANDDQGSTTEPVQGDLRKHSVTTMKDLGQPVATDVEAGAEEHFDFQKFMADIRNPSANPIARYLKSFFQEFCRGVWTLNQQERIVADFLKFISVKLKDFEPFKSNNKREFKNSLEGIEKLVMTRIYNRVYPPQMPPLLRTDSHNEELIRDQVFAEKLRLWGWVEGKHLDLNESYLNSDFIKVATSQLTKLSEYKSPRDKMICVLNCSKVVFALIRQLKLEQNADSFLPLLIYVVLRAQPAHLPSTVDYIQRFRNKLFQRGETAYYLSTLASAATFIEQLDKTNLTISEVEFEQRMTDSVRAETNRAKQEQSKSLEENTENGESPSAIIATSATMLVERMMNFTTKLIDDISNPEEQTARSSSNETQQQQHPASTGSSSGSRPTSSRRQREEAEFEQQMQNSLREQEEHDQTILTLQNMFPVLDNEVIEDVVRQQGFNIGSAVDICLALVGE